MSCGHDYVQRMGNSDNGWCVACLRAEVERLRAEIERLRAALKAALEQKADTE